MSDTLTVGCGLFGTFAATHFFNCTDEVVAQSQDAATLSAIACAPLYTERFPEKFEPRLALVGQEHLLYQNPDLHVPIHPFQVALQTGFKAGDALGPYDLSNTVRTFRDFAEFPIRTDQLGRLRANRALDENLEAMESTLRRQLELSECLGVVNMFQDLAPNALSVNPAEYLLDETPKKAMAAIVGLPTDSQPAPFASNALEMLKSFVDCHEMLSNRSGKILLPILLQPQPSNLNGFQTSAAAALVTESLTLPYRSPLSRYDAHSMYSSLVPSFSCLATVSLSVSNGMSATPLCDSGLHKRISELKMPSSTKHGLWTRVYRCSKQQVNDDRRNVWFPDPLALAISHPLHSPTVQAEQRLTDFCAWCPIQDEATQSQSGREEAGFLDFGLTALNAALLNTNLVPRSEQEDWNEVREKVLVLLDDLKLCDFDVDREYE